MSSTHVDALARPVTALLLLVAMPGCQFDPVGAAPGDASTPVDSRPPVDSSLPPVEDGRTPVDSRLPADGSPPIEIDAMENPLRRKQITIDRGQVEAPSSPGFLTDFPVLFAVQDSQIMTGARGDENNVYFVDGDGTTRLAHEIEKWDPGSNTLVAWVKVPRVFDATDTSFFVYYGAPAPGGPVDPSQVWNNGYVAVWHLAERPGTAGGITDSTGGNDGTAHASMQASDLVGGRIGDGIDFDGVDDEITFQNPLTGPGPHTISAWVNQRATTTADAVVVLGDGEMNRARWFYSAFGAGVIAAGFYSNDLFSDDNIIDDDWTLLHWTYQDRDNVIYVDGAPAHTERVGNGVDTRGGDGRLGNVPSTAFGTNMNLNGQMDEVRIATVARPDEWIRTEYNNQSSPSSFYTVGPEILP